MPASQSRPLPEGGAVRPITRWGTPVMHRELEDVTVFDDELLTLVKDMVATMYAADGVGLAACQVGVDLRVFVFDCPDDSGDHTVGVVCNPVVTLPEGKDLNLEEAEEGCLSFPGAFIDCARPGNAHACDAIAALRRSLLAEHCGLEEDEVARLLAADGSICEKKSMMPGMSSATDTTWPPKKKPIAIAQAMNQRPTRCDSGRNAPTKAWPVTGSAAGSSAGLVGGTGCGAKPGWP